MSYILDLIIILIILFFIISSARRGFVRVLLEVIGFILAISLTLTISTPLSRVTYDKIIEPSLLKTANEENTENIQEIVDNAWEALPGFITINAQRLNLNTEDISRTVTENMQDGTQAALKATSQKIIKPIAVKVLGLCYSTILLGILFFVVRLLAKSINKLFSFSLVGKINKTLGGAVGLLKGIIFAAFFTALISLIISFTENGFWIFTYENIANSYLFKLFTGIIPFKIF